MPAHDQRGVFLQGRGARVQDGVLDRLGIARALAGDGWDVVVGARSGGQVEAVATEIGGEWVQVDVSDRNSVERMVAGAGEVDLLVANAAAAP